MGPAATFSTGSGFSEIRSGRNNPAINSAAWLMGAKTGGKHAVVRTTSRRYVNDDAPPPPPPIGRPPRGAGHRSRRAPRTVRVGGAIHAPPQPRAAVGRRPRTPPRQLRRRHPLRLPRALLVGGRPPGQGRGRAVASAVRAGRPAV